MLLSCLHSNENVVFLFWPLEVPFLSYPKLWHGCPACDWLVGSLLIEAGCPVTYRRQWATQERETIWLKAFENEYQLRNSSRMRNLAVVVALLTSTIITTSAFTLLSTSTITSTIISIFSTAIIISTASATSYASVQDQRRKRSVYENGKHTKTNTYMWPKAKSSGKERGRFEKTKLKLFVLGWKIKIRLKSHPTVTTGRERQTLK